MQQQGWLTLASSTKGAKANVYGLGSLFNEVPGLLDEWVLLASQLLDRNGVLRPFVDRPCMAHGALGINGTLILALAVAAEGPLELSELRPQLRCWMTKPTLNGHLRSLAAKRLLTVCDGFVVVEADWSDRLLGFEEHGPLKRRKRIIRRNRTEQVAFRNRIGVSSILPALRIDYAGFPCCRCRKPSEQVEHFPPRAWGGPDDWYTTWPICKRCNNSMSQFIRDVGPPQVDFNTEPHLRIGADPARFLAAALQRRRDDFYRAFENGDIGAAHAATVMALDLHKAFKGQEVPEVTWFECPSSPRSKPSLSRGRPARWARNLRKPGRRPGVTTRDEAAWYPDSRTS